MRNVSHVYRHDASANQNVRSHDLFKRNMIQLVKMRLLYSHGRQNLNILQTTAYNCLKIMAEFWYLDWTGFSDFEDQPKSGLTYKNRI